MGHGYTPGAQLIFPPIPIQVSSLLSGRRTPSPTNNGYLFLGTLAGLEALIVKYWINGRIYTVSRAIDL